MAEVKKVGRPRGSRTLGLSSRHLSVSRAGLHEHALERLRGLIVGGHLAPGTVLNEAELSDVLGISRTPLREALKLLAAERLVELRPNRSARITQMRSHEVRELFEAISGIERLAAEMAAQRITPRELTRLRTLQDTMERRHAEAAREEYFRANQQIHRLIVSAAKNGPLREVHGSLLARAERARYFALLSQGRWDQSIAEHREILAALEARDAERAGRALGEHVMRTGTVVNEILSEKASLLTGEESTAAE